MAYKLKHKGVPALMKALVGNQHKLPAQLKRAIEAAPEMNPDKKETSTAADKAAYAKYKASGGKLTMTQAKKIGFKSPAESKQKLAEVKAKQTEKAVAERKRAEAKGLGTKFYADTQKDIYEKAAPKKVGIGTKSTKERIYEYGRKQKKANTTKRATMTKSMHKYKASMTKKIYKK